MTVVWSADAPVSRARVFFEATAAAVFHYRTVLRGYR